MKVHGTIPINPAGVLPAVVRGLTLRRIREPIVGELTRVYKLPVFADEKASIEILILEPGAEVKEHRHLGDEEIYISWSKKKQFFKWEVCPKGGTHSLQNISTKHWAWVISFKVK